jgi:hypothetical protein
MSQLIEPTELTTEIEKINSLTQVEMARLWRYAPSGHKYFDDRLPYFAVFKKRFDELGGMTPNVSKNIGWNDNDA